MAAVVIMSSAVFSSLRAYALCQRKRTSFLVLALGSANAVPSVFGAIKTRATLNNIDAACDVDYSQFLSFRNALLAMNVVNLAFINNVKLLFILVGGIAATTVLLTCRFILDLFEASARGGSGASSTLRLSALPSLWPSRSLAVDADASWRGRTEDGESVCSNPDDRHGFELQVITTSRREP
ncbi:uncharacterized protein BXZ73DRAFT_105140 [Epithele typhae]|uniref:uncharacterized protein n=1 Tax=Epithele typhae TaxID=378194 RepID=UPI00200767E5|nr:uncharacterized protein BXZ73DRAFT_105140 [Epithele typhae]KAH9918745.1 hypothetical protein BXZ73DRAFT_105140 [Epithele typhae]